MTRIKSRRFSNFSLEDSLHAFSTRNHEKVKPKTTAETESNSVSMPRDYTLLTGKIINNWILYKDDQLVVRCGELNEDSQVNLIAICTLYPNTSKLIFRALSYQEYLEVCPTSANPPRRAPMFTWFHILSSDIFEAVFLKFNIPKVARRMFASSIATSATNFFTEDSYNDPDFMISFTSCHQLNSDSTVGGETDKCQLQVVQFHLYISQKNNLVLTFERSISVSEKQMSTSGDFKQTDTISRNSNAHRGGSGAAHQKNLVTRALLRKSSSISPDKQYLRQSSKDKCGKKDKREYKQARRVLLHKHSSVCSADNISRTNSCSDFTGGPRRPSTQSVNPSGKTVVTVSDMMLREIDKSSVFTRSDLLSVNDEVEAFDSEEDEEIMLLGDKVEAWEGVIFSKIKSSLTDESVHMKLLKSKGSPFLVHVCSNAVLDSFSTVINYYSDQQMEVSSDMLFMSKSYGFLEGDEKLKHMDTVNAGHELVVNLLERSLKSLQCNESSLERVIDLEWIHDSVISYEHALDVVGDLKRELHLMQEIIQKAIHRSALQTKTVLMMIYAAFLPLHFISGIFGMNFERGGILVAMMEAKDGTFVFFVVCVAFFAVCIGFFQWKGWLDTLLDPERKPAWELNLDGNAKSDKIYPR